MELYENLTLDEERALYHVENAQIRSCVFDGPADGESALKECRNIQVENCDFRLRYPFWHCTGAVVENSRMTEGCRAALWYDRDVTLKHCEMNGIKALRECDESTVEDCRIVSPEFGWLCRGLIVRNTELTSEYPFFQCRNVEMDGLTLHGKYSFQYVENMVIRNSVLDTKDAFWHSRNVTVYDSVVKGEYLAWYSQSLRLVRCKIIGTQPLCYARDLVLEDCEMVDCDLSFEYSDVQATVRGEITRVKNPRSGRICAGSVGEVILDEFRDPEHRCEIVTGENR